MTDAEDAGYKRFEIICRADFDTGKVLGELLQNLNRSIVYCALIRRNLLQCSASPIHQIDEGLGMHQITWPYISVNKNFAMSCLHRHLLHVVDNACKENAQNTAMHRRTPLAQQPGIQ